MKKTLLTLSAAAILTVTNAAQADYRVAKVDQATPQQVNEALQTRVFENDSPCDFSLIKGMPESKTGIYSEFYPAGSHAPKWNISFKQVGGHTEMTLGDGFIPGVYGVTYDGKYLVSHTGEPIDPPVNDKWRYLAMHPVWAVQSGNSWGCFYLPGAKINK